MRLTRVGVALVALLVLPLLAAAQRRAANTDERELAAYRFSEATLAKYIRASRGLAAVVRTMPVDTAQDAEDADDEKDEDDEDGDGLSIAQMMAMYDSIPGARRAITGAGLTTREFVVFGLTMFQAGMAAWLVEQHGWDKLPPQIARENVLFYQRHKAQLDSLTSELRGRSDREP